MQWLRYQGKGHAYIDNFNPINDHCGFQRGNVVIKAIGEIISRMAWSSGGKSSCFCGHIGGDDFIVITEPHQAEKISSQVIKALEEQLPLFHGCEKETFPQIITAQ